MVHPFVHTVRSDGGTQGVRHVMYRPRLDTRCIQNVTTHYVPLTSLDTIVRLVAVRVYVALTTFLGINYVAHLWPILIINSLSADTL